MNKRVIVGELAGIAWLAADAFWALGDVWHAEMPRTVTGLFALGVILAGVFVVMQCKGAHLER